MSRADEPHDWEPDAYGRSDDDCRICARCPAAAIHDQVRYRARPIQPPPIGLCRDTVLIYDDHDEVIHHGVCLLAAGHTDDPARSDYHKDGAYAWVRGQSWLCSETVT